jgi:AsmA protein
MLTLLRWLAGFALSLLLLLAVAAVIIPRVVDPNDFRDEIALLVKDQTGRELTLQGDLQVSVFPWLGIKTQGLSLAQPSRIGGNMLEVEAAQLRVKLMPLFSRRVEVDTVVLESPIIRLLTLADGYDSFSEFGADAQGGAANQQADTNTDSVTAAVALVIQGLELSNGQIVIDDREAGSLTELTDLNVSTGNLLGAELANIVASGKLKDTTGAADIVFDLTALGKIDTQTLRLEIKDLNSEVVLGKQVTQLSFAGFDFQQTQEVLIQGFQAEVFGVIESSEGIKVFAKTVEANLDAQLIKVPQIRASFGELNGLINNLTLRDFADNLKASGRVSVPAFDASKLVRRLDAELAPADPQALRNVAAEFSFLAGIDSVELNKLNLAIDKTTLTGSAKVNGFAAPSYNFDLSLDQLDMDRYLAQSEESAQPAETGSGSQALLVPMAIFKDVNANGRFRAQQVISGGLKLQNIDVQVESSPGQVKIIPKADLYQGKLGGEIAYVQIGERSELKLKNEIDLVALGELLNAVELTDQLSGIGTLVLDLLVAEQNGVQSNSGTIKVLAKNGAIQGVDIKNIVDQGYARYQQLKGKEAAPSDGESTISDETKFAELLGTFHLNNSVLSNDDFSLKAPLFRVGGAGTIDLERQTIDYSIDFSVVSSTDGQGGQAFDKLKGITIPIRLRGSLTAPNYSLDMNALYKGLVKNELESKKSQLIKEKYGIEGSENLSTKDIFKQILIRKATQKDDEAGGREQAIEDVGRRPAESQVSSEQPIEDIGSRSAESPVLFEQQTPAEEVIEDVSANPDAPQEPEKSAKEQLKADLKKKLLEGLFN